MGTRALIKVFDVDGEEICTIYTQTDGYPDGWMLDVARFLSERKLVNGFNKYDVVNGMNDLVAQIVTLLKLKDFEVLKHYIMKKKSEYFHNDPSDEVHGMILAGGIYVMPAGTKDVDEEWVYHIKPDDAYVSAMKGGCLFGVEGGIIIEVYRPIEMFNSSNGLKLVWKGTPKEYVDEFGSKE